MVWRVETGENAGGKPGYTASTARPRHGFVLSPLVVAALFAGIFFVLALINLDQPHHLYFDEVYYPVSGKKLLEWRVKNREHPMLAKEIMAACIYLFGDNWIGLRIGSLTLASLGLFGFQLSITKISGSIKASIIFWVLAVGNCLYLTTSRIGILDPYMLGFAGLSLPAYISAWKGEKELRNLVLSGLLIGAALACKWSVAPLAGAMGLALIFRHRSRWRNLLAATTAFGCSAAVIYVTSFLPLLFDVEHPLKMSEFFALHRAMIHHLALLTGGHPYASHWWDWIFGRGQMWLFDGQKISEKGLVILGQNPLAALITIVAVPWGFFRLFTKKDWVAGAPCLAYASVMLFWIFNTKPVLFLYHYNLASVFALAVAAIGLSRIKRTRPIYALLGCYIAVFVFFLPASDGWQIGEWGKIYRSLPWWEVNSKSGRNIRILGNGSALSHWSYQCLDEPSLIECKEDRRNVVQDRYERGEIPQ